MYLTNFDIEYRPNAVELTTYLSDLEYKLNRNKNKITIVSNNYEESLQSLKIGIEFLNAKDAVFESWIYDEEENLEEEETFNPYNEYGLTQSMFY